MCLTEYPSPLPEPPADPALAELAEMGGQRFVAELSARAMGDHPLLTPAYGRIQRFADRGTYSEAWFQPVGNVPAQRLVIPRQPWWCAEICWAAFEAEGGHPVVVITAPVPNYRTLPDCFDAMLVAVAVDPVERFLGPTTVVTAGTAKSDGRGVWPEVIELPALVEV